MTLQIRLVAVAPSDVHPSGASPQGIQEIKCLELLP